MPGPEEGYVGVLRGCAGEGGVMVKGEAAEDVLRRGFGKQIPTSVKDGTATATATAAGGGGGGGGGAKWDDEATEWQLELERWIIDDGRAGEMARKAFVSHVRAYATHVVAERRMFDVKGLHLGHLAKAFGLRERPGDMGRGGVGGRGSSARKGERGEKKGKKRLADGSGGDGDGALGDERTGKEDRDGLPARDGHGLDAAKKMRSKMKEHIAGAGEFNIG